MHIEGVEIKLDPAENLVALAEDDWTIDCGAHMMRHLPTTLTFHIDMDDEAKQAGGGTALNFVARPIHVFAGHRVPSPTAMTELGRAAILLYLHGAGLLELQPKDGTPTCEPDRNMN